MRDWLDAHLIECLLVIAIGGVVWNLAATGN